MRRDDINGARCRSDGVWIALARDFIKRQLETKKGERIRLGQCYFNGRNGRNDYDCLSDGLVFVQ